MIDVEAELDALLGDAHAIVLDPTELLARFPEGAMTPDLMKRAGALGLADLDDATVRELAATLAQLQVSARQVLTAALDASIARLGRERLGALIELRV